MSAAASAATGIHIWAITAHGEHPRAAALLESTEKERAAAFHSPQLARTWRYFHCALREILSCYTAQPASDLRFDVGPQGKPCLARQDTLHFNLSHSDELALLAITQLAPVGVDVERVRGLKDMTRLARHCFSTVELAAFDDCDESDCRSMFFNLWTRKEAVLKASSLGLSMPLDCFDVPSVRAQGWHSIVVRDNQAQAPRYQLAALGTASGYAGAVAIVDSGAPELATTPLYYHRY